MKPIIDVKIQNNPKISLKTIDSRCPNLTSTVFSKWLSKAVAKAVAVSSQNGENKKQTLFHQVSLQIQTEAAGQRILSKNGAKSPISLGQEII